MLHAVEGEEQAAVPTVEITHTSAIAIDPQAEELSKELSRTALIWDAITCQFDVSRTPRLVTAVDAVLADLKRDEASAFAPLAART